MKQGERLRRVGVYCLPLVFVFVLFFATASVLAIARGYTTDDGGLQTGMVVSLSNEGDDSRVERATQDASSRAIGVVADIEGSLVTVGSGDSKVLVESEGQIDAYVSDINGAIKKGDLLILSPLKGILMRGDDQTPAKVIGVAAQEPAQTSPYKFAGGGATKETQIAKIKIDLSYLGTSTGSNASDSALTRLGRAIVGKDVGEIRVLIALIVFLVVLIAEGGILYGAISSAITALGRNPLARQIIRTELVRVVLVAIIVLMVGLGSVYMILWI